MCSAQSPTPDLSPPTSPRNSDMSFHSAQTMFSALPNKAALPKPLPTSLPTHASTSTISRDSDARPPSLSIPTLPALAVPAPRTGTNRSIPPPLPEPLSMGRIPKGRVFVHRDPDRPRPPLSPATPASSTTVTRRTGLPPRRSEKRCISDLQDVARRAALTSALCPSSPPPRQRPPPSPTSPPPPRHYRSAPVSALPPLSADPDSSVTPSSGSSASPSPPGPSPRRRGALAPRVRSDLADAVSRLAHTVSAAAEAEDPPFHTVPSWIPSDELRDWAASPSFADGATRAGEGGVPECEALSSASDDEEDEERCGGRRSNGRKSSGSSHGRRGIAPVPLHAMDESRWANSLRSITTMYARARYRPPPAIRGSVLVVAPPTLTERLGLLGLTERRPRMHSHSQPPGESHAHVPHEQPPASAPPTCRVSDRVNDGPSADEYVGFLVEGDTGSGKGIRKGWRRLLRRTTRS